MLSSAIVNTSKTLEHALRKRRNEIFFTGRSVEENTDDDRKIEHLELTDGQHRTKIPLRREFKFARLKGRCVRIVETWQRIVNPFGYIWIRAAEESLLHTLEKRS